MQKEKDYKRSSIVIAIELWRGSWQAGQVDQTNMEIASRRAGLSKTQPQNKVQGEPSNLSAKENCVLDR